MSNGEFETRPHAFFGYPSQPETSRETLCNAAEFINEQSDDFQALTWEDIDMVGRLIIDQITNAIDNSVVSVFDVTSLNANVMFEIGYAIGARKKLYLALDTTDRNAEKSWKDVGILSTVGYQPYSDALTIAMGVIESQPLDGSPSIFEQSLLPGLDPLGDPTIFYMKRPFVSEAEREVSRRIERRRNDGFGITYADPKESPFDSLSWYANKCYSASAVVIHLLGPRRKDHEVHNARAALVAGLAHGMAIPTLMLAEEGYAPPIDYKDMLVVYRNSRAARDATDDWLDRELAGAVGDIAARAEEAGDRHRRAELESIRLGDYVAENEADKLANYFQPTAAFEEVLGSNAAVFVGRKGVGKTATLIQAQTELGRDKRNLVCIVRPNDYDFDGIVRTIGSLRAPDSKSYAIQAIWKYLLVSEIARAVVDVAQARPAGIGDGSPEWALREYLDEIGASDDSDLAVRFDQAVKDLNSAESGQAVTTDRERLTDALHARRISKLVKLLDPVLGDYERVAVLVDDLDQAWQKSDHTDAVARLLVGLLDVTRGFAVQVFKSISKLDVSVAVFLRSDIYFKIAPQTREPDKLPTTFVTWKDPEQLLRLVETRFVADRDYKSAGSELWGKYFVPSVGGVPTREYLASRVLPRPRDMIRFTKAAIETAVRLGHPRVKESDVIDAEGTYSQFAFDAMVVEGSEANPNIENVLYEFAGANAIVTVDEVKDLVKGCGLDHAEMERTVSSLVALSFLGRETKSGVFQFAENPRDDRRNSAVAAGFARRESRSPRLKIHPAFHAYLGVVESHRPRGVTGTAPVAT